MDLSSRVLLKDRQVILLTHPKNVDLYSKDEWFHRVYSSPQNLVSELGRNAFDLVLCDSYSPRVLAKKLFVAPFVEFAGLYGYLNGFEVHRTLFSFCRMRDLLGITLEDNVLRPSITFERAGAGTWEYDVCLAVGGEWEFRAYAHWLDVAIQLESMGLSVILVGSENGRSISEAILEETRSVVSSVGVLELRKVASLMARCRLFVGADGGLWHIASSIPIPTLVLFADCQIFEENGVRVTRETKDMECLALYHSERVSDISPATIVEEIRAFFGAERR